MFWFREFKRKERTRRAILKKGRAGDEAILKNVVVNLTLKNKEQALRVTKTNNGAHGHNIVIVA